MKKLFFDENYDKVNEELFPQKNKKINRAVEVSNLNIRDVKKVVSRIGTRTIKFSKINGFDNYNNDNNYYISEPNVYIDHIQFTEGDNGIINYDGDPEHKPNICKNDFYLKIPQNVSKFIIRTTILGTQFDGKTHWMIDLKSKFGIALSHVCGSGNLENTEKFKNSSALVNNYDKSDNYFIGGQSLCNLNNIVDDRYSPTNNIEINLFYEIPM